MEFFFVSGNLALDFIGTLKWRRSVTEELLERPEDFDQWAMAANAVTESAGCASDELDRIKALREDLCRLVSAKMADDPYEVHDMHRLNDAANQGFIRTELTPAGLERRGSAQDIAAAIARSAAELLVSPEAELIKECARDACTRIFIDRSRGHNRAWCGMDECGNRIKAANYRSRKRSRTATSIPIASKRPGHSPVSANPGQM
ncbi:MAG: CGNR zinc finger domain-containing protein [Lacisediminihabitans sp.]